MGRIAYKSVTILSLQPSCVKSNCQGDGDVPGQNSRSATLLSVYSSPLLAIIFALALPHFSQKRQTSHQPAPRLA